MRTLIFTGKRTLCIIQRHPREQLSQNSRNGLDATEDICRQVTRERALEGLSFNILIYPVCLVQRKSRKVESRSAFFGLRDLYPSPYVCLCRRAAHKSNVWAGSAWWYNSKPNSTPHPNSLHSQLPFAKLLQNFVSSRNICNHDTMSNRLKSDLSTDVMTAARAWDTIW